MSKVNMFFATGYEEVEALTVVDLLRREGIEVNMVSVTGEKEIANILTTVPVPTEEWEKK